jgi:hypothetical protein
MLNFKFLRGYEVRILTGRQFLEAGYVWVPWIPMQTTPVVHEEPNRRETLTRYARKMINSNFFETINLTH